ncbi:MAG: lipoate--protein ligase family protein [Anaerolineae bacterium]|jgi:lipoate-protein ligase A
MAGERVSAYAPAVWRLVVDGEADGATNMAMDQAILEAVVEGVSPPTLRFYAWSPPCLSLGRSQALADVDLAACKAAGIDTVRRPTGGRSILHTDELTYSVALLQTDPRSEGGVVEGYRRLSEGLLAGLRQLGVPAVQAVGVGRSNEGQTAICFETPADYEITAAGRKLVGSAQWRARGGVLQHGTLPLCGDLSRIVSYLALSDAEREIQRHRILLRAMTLEEAIGRVLTFDKVAQALAAGFARALNLSLVLDEVTALEGSMASELRDRLYSAPDWTRRL